MDILFVDDSEQKGLRKGMGKLRSLGGIIVREQGLLPLHERLEGIANDLGLPPGSEIKWSPPRDSPLRKLTSSERKDLYTRVIDAARDLGAMGLVVILILEGWV